MHKLNKKLKENLYSEIHILKTLHHPHIVALIDCHETSAHIHLVMEYCELGDLSYFIKKRDTIGRHETTANMVKKYPNPAAGGLNEVIVRHFLKQLASAIEFLRANNLIHRDVKPQNLLLDPSPQFYARSKPEVMPYAAHEKSLTPMVGVESLPTLKIADFGFARSLPTTSLAETLCGSPLYMAPEILRYEKYDAKADLWSVGTVLYEMMVGKPPFRASNHVELLRKIERGEDRIRFPEEVCLSDSMKKLIRALLKRNPVERISFPDFFNNTVVKDAIPGLAEEDRVLKPETVSAGPQPHRSNTNMNEGVSTSTSRPDMSPDLLHSPRKQSFNSPQTAALKSESPLNRRLSGTPPRVGARDLREQKRSSETVNESPKENPPQIRRPTMTTHATAPERQDLHVQEIIRGATAMTVKQQPSRTSLPPPHKAHREQPSSKKEEAVSKETKETRERAAQDVAFERDYVLVEKRAVEVNAFADELAASPRIQGVGQAAREVARGGMVRRATTQGPPESTIGAQVASTRAMQIASKGRSDQGHFRRNSLERRLRDPMSTTSAISKAINMASGRLFGLGVSPPLGIGRGGPSPPSYSPFPAYPAPQGNLLVTGEVSKTPVALDEDTKAVHVIEESATRSDVVYGFAEVKYKQLIPFAPVDQGLGLRQAGIPEGEIRNSVSEDEGLTADAIVTLSEEALVLYVKALALLARSMDIAGGWWAQKNKGEIVDVTTPRTQPDPAAGIAVSKRVNNVVQWVRNRFNEVLEKAEFVSMKLIEAQKQLTPDHPSHPLNHPSTSSSTTGMGTSAENVVVTSGVTAEKLMYDRALEMSRAAAVNELVGDDLPGCEIAYVTAVRMLEAVLEDEDEHNSRKSYSAEKGRGHGAAIDAINGVEADDREVVSKRGYPWIHLYACHIRSTNLCAVVHSIRSRLIALRKKLQIISRRSSSRQVSAPSKTSDSTVPNSTSVIATTPPR